MTEPRKSSGFTPVDLDVSGARTYAGFEAPLQHLRSRITLLQAPDDGDILDEVWARQHVQPRLSRMTVPVFATVAIAACLMAVLFWSAGARHGDDEALVLAEPTVAVSREPLVFQVIPGGPPDVGGAGSLIVPVQWPLWRIDPASGARVGIRVPAEVLVGADGVVRAVRFPEVFQSAGAGGSPLALPVVNTQPDDQGVL